MKKIGYLVLVFCSCLSFSCLAQSYAFGLKGGLTVGTQKWDNSFEREPLFRQHAIAFIESAEEEEPFALFAQAGYHTKGSAIRTFRGVFTQVDGSQVEVPATSTPFLFNNVSVTLGAKQKFDFSGEKKLYYLFGIRGDYTVSTKLRPDNLSANASLLYGNLYPFDEFVNRFNYGATVGGGIELPFADLAGLILEFTVNPDFSYQYNQPEIRNVINPNPFGGTNRIDIPERQIVNLTFELSLGFRFINKVVYID